VKTLFILMTMAAVLVPMIVPTAGAGSAAGGDSFDSVGPGTALYAVFLMVWGLLGLSLLRPAR
jgi:hypothetical protein